MDRKLRPRAAPRALPLAGASRWLGPLLHAARLQVRPTRTTLSHLNDINGLLKKRKTGSADKIAVHDVNKCWRPPPRAPRRCTYLALVNFPVRGKCRSVQPWGATREDRMAE